MPRFIPKNPNDWEIPLDSESFLTVSENRENDQAVQFRWRIRDQPDHIQPAPLNNHAVYFQNIPNPGWYALFTGITEMYTRIGVDNLVGTLRAELTQAREDLSKQITAEVTTARNQGIAEEQRIETASIAADTQLSSTLSTQKAVINGLISRIAQLETDRALALGKITQLEAANKQVLGKVTQLEAVLQQALAQISQLETPKP